MDILSELFQTESRACECLTLVSIHIHCMEKSSMHILQNLSFCAAQNK